MIYPLMQSNEWGPLKFILVFNEVYTPNKPNGFYEEIINDLTWTFSCGNKLANKPEERMSIKMSVIR